MVVFFLRKKNIVYWPEFMFVRISRIFLLRMLNCTFCWWERSGSLTAAVMAKVDRRALLKACERGDIEYLRQLKQQKLQVTNDTKYGRPTALHLAAE